MPDLEEFVSVTYYNNPFFIAGQSLLTNTSLITTIYLPKFKTYSNIINLVNSNVQFPHLRDVWLGEFSHNINFTQWTATSVTATAEGIVEINANIRNHLAARIKDMTGQTSPTITFGANLYNNLEQSTKDAFAAKNWTVASA